MSTLAVRPPAPAAAHSAHDDLARVLLVQDIPVATELLAESLEFDRFVVERAATGEEARRILFERPPSMLLVDLALSGMTGLDLIELVREGAHGSPWDAHLPVVALCRGSDALMPLRAIERGADDALRMPFHYPELVARVTALLRRARGASTPSMIHAGPITIDRLALTASLHGCELGLSAKEFNLLAALARDPKRVLTKDELLRRVWGYSTAVRTRTIDTHASRLRRKLAEVDPTVRMVCNVWGVGYRLLPFDE